MGAFAEFARSWTKAKTEERRLLTPEYFLPYRPQAPAGQQRLEGPAHRQGEVGSEDTRPNRPCASGGGAPALSVISG